MEAESGTGRQFKALEVTQSPDHQNQPYGRTGGQARACGKARIECDCAWLLGWGAEREGDDGSRRGQAGAGGAGKAEAGGQRVQAR